MYCHRAILLAGVACAALAEPSYAQDTASETPAAISINDIVVTARRKGESLQDVPQTVNAVAADTIQKLRINNASDIAQIVPGLSIEGSSSGASGAFGASSGLRGVPTFLSSNASPVVQFYLNDAPTGRGPEVTRTLFDIGQVEVLKGPQGTLRGRSAPTGAITITSRKPDLDQIGGFLNMSASSRGNMNVQAAVGVPIIKDVLALRVAGVVDQNEANSVTSINYRADPLVRNEAVRATLLFEPTPDFEAQIMYQGAWRNSRTFKQVAKFGSSTDEAPITASQRLGITDRPDIEDGNTDFIVGQAEWRFGGQKLNYVGSYRRTRSNTASTQDAANVLPGVEYYQTAISDAKETSHELRLSSEERIFDIFDYTIGGFYDREKSHTDVDGVAQFLTGAFGRPGAPVVQNPLDRYTLRTAITIDPIVTEKSAFASLTAHLGSRTELSGGVRYIDFKRRDRVTLDLLGGFNALNNPTRGLLPCSALGALSPALTGAVASPVYTGAPSVCDLPIAGRQLQNLDRSKTFKPLLYNVSLSHKFTPDFMAYGNVGSAFRSAGPAIGITSALTCCTQAGGPDLGSIEDLIFHGQERSTTYELGFKSSFFDRRVRLNVALFKQKFDNFFFLTQSTRYLAVTDPNNPLASNINSSEFTADADAKVKGIDVELGFQVTPRWNVDLGFTWSKAQLDDALVPCNDGNFDGVVDTIVPTTQDFIDAGVMVARCRSSESISRTPRWNLTVQSEYSAPLSDRTDAFIRGNFVYYPDNPNATQIMVIDKYSLLNLFAGVRDAENGWEISLFANNVLNTQQVLSVNPVAPVSAGGAAAIFGRPQTDYFQIGYTPRREVGLLVRYAFGGR
ncbi:TonB-dependent receptor [Novosphingobium sp. ZW T3_23]|uniref:TonB-dependent receptor n=1 Tax=Novosphingobium sp. ZW T3_23 TaxID=3378084 RepID=UPI003853291A